MEKIRQQHAKDIPAITKRMKIVHVTKYFYPHQGGIETYTYNLYKELKKKAEVKIITTDDLGGGKLKDNCITRVPIAFRLFSGVVYPKVILELNKVDTDILHLHFPDPFLALAFCLSRPKYKKLVVSYHSDIVKQKALLFIFLPFINHVLKNAEIIHIATPRIGGSRDLLMYREKLRVIHYGINTRTTYVSAEEKKPYILFVGRLVYYKGVEYLIKAVKGLDIELFVIGEGPLKKELKRNAPKNVRFLGNIDYIAPYYKSCEFFVLPSVEKTEAFGIVLLEAMAYSKPVISTSLGTGTDYVNYDGQTGLVVEPRNVSQLRNAIKKLLKDKKLRKKLGTNARKLVEDSYSIKDVSEEMYWHYNEILNSNNDK